MRRADAGRPIDLIAGAIGRVAALARTQLDEQAGRLRRAVKRRAGVPSIPAALDRLRARGLSPALIFDVGAYEGEFARECLARWPATVACFEVLDRPVEHLRTLAASEPRVRLHQTLLGGEVRAEVPFRELETASSVLAEHAGSGAPVRARPMTTVDEVVERSFGGTAPDLLKLDVQGYELEVLKGAERSLPRMQALLTEVNLLDIHVGVPLLADLVGWLAQRGWVAYDVCALTRRPLDSALWQVDMVFVPADSHLRADKRWG